MEMVSKYSRTNETHRRRQTQADGPRIRERRQCTSRAKKVVERSQEEDNNVIVIRKSNGKSFIRKAFQAVENDIQQQQ